MIIIKSTNGDRLRLTSKRLTEIKDDGEPTKYSFHTTKKALQNALDYADFTRVTSCPLFGSNSPGVEVYGQYKHTTTGVKVPNSCFVVFNLTDRQIGCKTFSPRTFALILKTMGLKT
jgi:hypothetical protein